MRFLLIFFIVMPILEVWVLLKVGGIIGGLNTVALVVLTAFIGVMLLRQQSFSTVLRARGKLEHGEAPVGEMVEGIFLAVGGALLLTPGFITDALGLCCLIPGVRRGLVGWGLRQLLQRPGVYTSTYTRTTQTRTNRDRHTIEGEYRREDEPRK